MLIPLSYTSQGIIHFLNNCLYDAYSRQASTRVNQTHRVPALMKPTLGRGMPEVQRAWPLLAS